MGIVRFYLVICYVTLRKCLFFLCDSVSLGLLLHFRSLLQCCCKTTRSRWFETINIIFSCWQVLGSASWLCFRLRVGSRPPHVVHSERSSYFVAHAEQDRRPSQTPPTQFRLPLASHLPSVHYPKLTIWRSSKSVRQRWKSHLFYNRHYKVTQQRNEGRVPLGRGNEKVGAIIKSTPFIFSHWVHSCASYEEKLF